MSEKTFISCLRFFANINDKTITLCMNMISIILPNELIPSVKLKVKKFLFPLSFSNTCRFANRNYYFLHYDTFIRWILTLGIDEWIVNILNCSLCEYATSILRTRKTKKIFFQFILRKFMVILGWLVSLRCLIQRNYFFPMPSWI